MHLRLDSDIPAKARPRWSLGELRSRILRCSLSQAWAWGMCLSVWRSHYSANHSLSLTYVRACICVCMRCTKRSPCVSNAWRMGILRSSGRFAQHPFERWNANREEIVKIKVHSIFVLTYSKEKGIYIEKIALRNIEDAHFIWSKEIKLKNHVNTYFYHKCTFNMCERQMNLYFFSVTNLII